MKFKLKTLLIVLLTTAVVLVAQQGTIIIKDRNSNTQAEVDSNNALRVAGTAGTPSKTTNLLSTPQTVTSTANSTLDSFHCTNTDSTNWAYVQIFDTASPSVGTTSAKWSVGLPPGGGAIGPMGPLAFATAITVAATTTATGSVSVDANEVNCNWGVK